MARLRATASAARSVLDGCEHDGMLSRVGSRYPKLTNWTIKKRDLKHIKKQDHAQVPTPESLAVVGRAFGASLMGTQIGIEQALFGGRRERARCDRCTGPDKWR